MLKTTSPNLTITSQITKLSQNLSKVFSLPRRLYNLLTPGLNLLDQTLILHLANNLNSMSISRINTLTYLRRIRLILRLYSQQRPYRLLFQKQIIIHHKYFFYTSYKQYTTPLIYKQKDKTTTIKKP